MQWLILPLILLSTTALAQSMEHKCYRPGGSPPSDVAGAQCYFQASVAATNLATRQTGWLQAACYADLERNTTPADIKTAKQVLKPIGNFQDREIQLNTFYIHLRPQLEVGDKNVPAAVLNSKFIIKVQTASARSADGEVHCKLRPPEIVNN